MNKTLYLTPGGFICIRTLIDGKESLLQQMPPWQGGGEMISEVRFEKTTYNELPFMVQQRAQVKMVYPVYLERNHRSLMLCFPKNNNTKAEIDKLCEGLRKVEKMLNV